MVVGLSDGKRTECDCRVGLSVSSTWRWSCGLQVASAGRRLIGEGVTSRVQAAQIAAVAGTWRGELCQVVDWIVSADLDEARACLCRDSGRSCSASRCQCNESWIVVIAIAVATAIAAAVWAVAVAGSWKWRKSWQVVVVVAAAIWTASVRATAIWTASIWTATVWTAT